MTMPNSLLIPLLDAHHSHFFGGKAAALAQMLAQGFRVPNGVVIPNLEFEKHLAHIQSLSIPQSEIAKQIKTTPLDPELITALSDYLEKNPGILFAVRSSALGEDSADHSWAGQLDTVLGVNNLLTLEQAIQTVWASAWSERSQFYQQQRGLTFAHMGIIVQEQINARHAGVLFTHAPIKVNNTPTMMIEYCEGLGDELVSGTIDPARVTVNTLDHTIVEHILSHDCVHSLADHEINELITQAKKLQAVFNCPLDIEWAFDQSGLLWLLQARPITTLTHSSGPENTSQNKLIEPIPLITWTNANIAENFPEPVCPLLYSIVRPGFAAYFRNLGHSFGIAAKRIRAMEPALQNLIGIHGGRLYYNLSNIHTLLRLAPAGRWLTQAFNAFVGAQEFPETSYPLPQQNLFERIAEYLRIPCKIFWQYSHIQSRAERFENTVTKFCEQTRFSQLTELPRAKLLEALRGFIKIRLHCWNDAALADTAAMVCYALLQRTLKHAWPEAGESAHNNLLVGLPNLASHTPVEQLWALSREVRANPKLASLFLQHQAHEIQTYLSSDSSFADFSQRFTDYLEHWGFRNSGELMLTQPSPQENPTQALALLKTYVEVDSVSPENLLAEQVQSRLTATQAACAHMNPNRLLRCLPLVSRAGRFRLLLKATQGAIRLRERVRMQQAKLYVHLRHILLACGRELVRTGQLEQIEDIFQLTIDELQDTLAGQAMFPYSLSLLVQQRREASDKLAQIIPPDSFTLAQGSYLPPQNSLISPLDTSPSEALTPNSNQLRGTGACGGTITAPAAVLANATQVTQMQEGDIVVTRQTDPGWACVFFLARGLVIERGGMLSHGAIIAREFGIPAVVGVRHATTLIRSKNRLAIDGDRGVVEILP